MLTAHVNYGLVKKGQDYVVLAEGDDWVQIKLHGGAVYTFRWVWES